MMEDIGDNDIVRAFIAIEVSDAVREALAFTTRTLRKTQARVSWVPAQNMHISLAFLGDIFGAKARVLAHALEGIAAELPPFTLEVRGLGTFGGRRKPRVIWAGVACIPEPLKALHDQVSLAVLDAGVLLDERPFCPHVTLGRIRASGKVDALTSAVGSAKDMHYGFVDIHRVLLMRSRLLPQGAQYSILHQAHLKGEK
ncbi:MAG: RNA 2',3'-cyclic phosphodiesterase [Spartobacteria bacterium]|nr:RNA 2',3'-cyclic phosphodiesterase [Spartobacteria bacterium]